MNNEQLPANECINLSAPDLAWVLPMLEDVGLKNSPCSQNSDQKKNPVKDSSVGFLSRAGGR